MESVLTSQWRLATDSHFQMRGAMLDQTHTVSISKNNSAHPMNTTYALSLYNCVKSNILRSVDKIVFWHENVSDGSWSFVGIAQVHTNKTPSNLKANTTVAYPFHRLLLNPCLHRVATCGDFSDKH